MNNMKYFIRMWEFFDKERHNATTGNSVLCAEFRKKGFSGSSGSFGGRNICLGIDPQGNEIMSDGVWYVYEGGMSPEEKDFVISQIKKQKDVK